MSTPSPSRTVEAISEKLCTGRLLDRLSAATARGIWPVHRRNCSGINARRLGRGAELGVVQTLWLRVPAGFAGHFLCWNIISNLNKRKSMLSRILSGRALAPVGGVLAVFFQVFASSVLLTFIDPGKRLSPRPHQGGTRRTGCSRSDPMSTQNPPGYDPYFIQTSLR